MKNVPLIVLLLLIGIVTGACGAQQVPSAADTSAAVATAAAEVESAVSEDDVATAAAEVESAVANTSEDDVATAVAEGGTLLEVAANQGEFTTLITAIEAAGLGDTLEGAGPFTVFAPTDAAFAALPEGTLEQLLADPELIESILSYHVAEGMLMSSQLSSGTTVPTVQGEEIAVSTSGSDVLLNNDARVTDVDIEATNGVIHVIDKVLLPPGIDLSS